MLCYCYVISVLLLSVFYCVWYVMLCVVVCYGIVCVWYVALSMCDCLVYARVRVLLWYLIVFVVYMLLCVMCYFVWYCYACYGMLWYCSCSVLIAYYCVWYGMLGWCLSYCSVCVCYVGEFGKCSLVGLLVWFSFMCVSYGML